MLVAVMFANMTATSIPPESVYKHAGRYSGTIHHPDAIGRHARHHVYKHFSAWHPIPSCL